MLADPLRPLLPFRLLAIGDQHQVTPAAVQALAAAGGREVAVLIRDRTLTAADLAARAAELVPICRAAGTLLLLHGAPEVAVATGADGVHLAEGASIASARAVLGGAAWIGASRHDLAGVHAAAAGGADYVTLSPVFATPMKAEPLGVAGFAAIVAASEIPVVALGGVTAANAAECRMAGAAAVAAIRAVWTGDIATNFARLVHAPVPSARRGGAPGEWS